MYKFTYRITTLHILFIVLVGVYTLLIFFATRLCLIQLIKASEQALTPATINRVLWYSLPFDFFIVAYLSVFPVLLFLFSVWRDSEKTSLLLFKITKWFYVFTLPVVLVLSIADIPYFLFFKNKLTESAFQWVNNPAILMEMLTSNTLHAMALAIACVACLVTIILVIKTANQFIKIGNHKGYSKAINTVISFVLVVIIFIGMRGRMDHPLREGDAFFSDNAVVNQLALNPIFTLIKSFEAKAGLMPENEALELTKQFLNINSVIDSISPIAQYIEAEKTNTKPNVILVLMESMSAAYMEPSDVADGLTPVLDSLSKISITHTNMYSAGIHTNNGVFSTLYGFPALKRIRPMSTVPLRKYSGIPYTLKQNGYETLFFTSHDKSFDNLGAFLPYNSFDKIISQNDYDPTAIVGPFGVPDRYLFSYAVNELSKSTKPFFATILTSSNHDPYIIPETFKKKFADKSFNAVHYADWSIGEFLQLCKVQPWYKNTIFLFIADHGLNVGEPISGFALNYHHIPFILFNPAKNEPMVVNDFVQQVDVYPYLMNVLQIPYYNNTLGVSPLLHTRKMIYFSADDKLAAMNSEWLYVYYYSGNEYLYKRNEKNSKNYIHEFKDIADLLKKYAFAQTQTADWLYRTNKTKVNQ
ncbi:MAG: sulfatase-like hydrolase/transferase [Bacteroidia bacterium]|nr:sulfatase-like hydrolase/transferase [Bacteroidia bacterium]MCZ2141080.1 sulfatase-like hydrolase/transferase [Bacteroidia bacterium]